MSRNPETRKAAEKRRAARRKAEARGEDHPEWTTTPGAMVPTPNLYRLGQARVVALALSRQEPTATSRPTAAHTLRCIDCTGPIVAPSAKPRVPLCSPCKGKRQAVKVSRRASRSDEIEWPL